MSLQELHELEGKTFYYKCPICPLEGQMGFKSKARLKAHYEDQHPVELEKEKIRNEPETKPRKARKRYFCASCPEHPGFCRRSTLDKHIATGHAKNLKKYSGLYCKICGKPCKTKIKARRHEESHHFVIQVPCQLCPFTTDSKREMTNHYFGDHPADPMPKLQNLRNDDSSGSEEEDEEEVIINKTFKDDSSDEEEDSDFDEDTIFLEKEKERFSSRGRMIKPLKKYVAIPRRSQVEKEVRICLERVDSKWPKGRVKRVKMADLLEEPEETWNEEEEMSFQLEAITGDADALLKDEKPLIPEHPEELVLFNFRVE